jgi:YesN/AraC family two-component response regulator
MELEELKKISSDMSVLVVEDEVEIQEYIVRFLSRLFRLVDSANNGVEALEKYKLNKYDIVISDIKMPQMDGLTLIEKIRNINKHQSIIVSSAHNESCLLIELLNDGICGFILKPIVINKVVDTLLRVCTRVHEKKMLIHYVNEMERLESELAAMQSCPI